jgi:hypothetical protein
MIGKERSFLKKNKGGFGMLGISGSTWAIIVAVILLNVIRATFNKRYNSELTKVNFPLSRNSISFFGFQTWEYPIVYMIGTITMLVPLVSVFSELTVGAYACLIATGAIMAALSLYSASFFSLLRIQVKSRSAAILKREIEVAKIDSAWARKAFVLCQKFSFFFGPFISLVIAGWYGIKYQSYIHAILMKFMLDLFLPDLFAHFTAVVLLMKSALEHFASDGPSDDPIMKKIRQRIRDGGGWNLAQFSEMLGRPLTRDDLEEILSEQIEREYDPIRLKATYEALAKLGVFPGTELETYFRNIILGKVTWRRLAKWVQAVLLMRLEVQKEVIEEYLVEEGAIPYEYETLFRKPLFLSVMKKPLISVEIFDLLAFSKMLDLLVFSEDEEDFQTICESVESYLQRPLSQNDKEFIILVIMFYQRPQKAIEVAYREMGYLLSPLEIQLAMSAYPYEGKHIRAAIMNLPVDAKEHYRKHLMDLIQAKIKKLERSGSSDFGDDNLDGWKHALTELETI